MSEMRLDGRRIAVLVDDQYEDLELWYPVLRLREEGAAVSIVGTGESSYRGKHGYPVRVDGNIDDADPDSFDAVVVPGGYAPDRLRRVPTVLDFVERLHEQGKIVAAICHAPWVLISARIVAGRRLTCAYAIRDDVINAGGEYVDREVVRDENLVTSRGPDDLGAFCREIVGALARSEVRAR